MISLLFCGTLPHPATLFLHVLYGPSPSTFDRYTLPVNRVTGKSYSHNVWLLDAIVCKHCYFKGWFVNSSPHTHTQPHIHVNLLNFVSNNIFQKAYNKFICEYAKHHTFEWVPLVDRYI